MSSSDIAISVRGLSKSYTIVHGQQRRPTFRDLVMDRLRNPFKRSAKETFWALKDVSFDIKKGEVVGIIGRNGAGKSTLLKILSRITEPTDGEIDLYGRVGSLLEVGTGFHPELTGRENIFLNGAILGMNRAEIRRQFDAIVDFAEVEKFLDTPVKRYSSGMYVRLAFAVAAHLRSQILLVDEVLAVGDANFQKKCMGKMEEVGSTGRTVIFVSHSMPSVTRLCRNAVLLERGGIVGEGPTAAVVGQYLRGGANGAAERVWADMDSPGDHVAALRAVRVQGNGGDVSEVIDISNPFSIEVEYVNRQTKLRPTVSIHLINEEGTTIFCSNDFNNRRWHLTPRRRGVVRARCNIPGHFLAEGRFYVLAAVCTYNPDVVHGIERDAVSFQIVEGGDVLGVRGEFGRAWPGVVRPLLDWDVEEVQDVTPHSCASEARL